MFFSTRSQQISRRRLTDSLQEERVVVEVVLNEENISLPLRSSPLHHDIQRALTKRYEYRMMQAVTEPQLASSSMSRNASDRASCTPTSGPTSFRTTSQPLRPFPSPLQPGTPFAQGTDSTKWGVRVMREPLPVATIAMMSGKPSWLTSPSLIGTGTDGLCDVSMTTREGGLEDWESGGKTSAKGMRTNAWQSTDISVAAHIPH